MQILDLSSNTFSVAQRGEHFIQMAEVPGSVLTGVTFFVSRSKASHAILG